MKRYTLAEIADQLDATLHGDGDITIDSVATLSSAEKGQISFFTNKKYRSQLDTTLASAILLQQDDLELCTTNALVLKNPYLGFAKLAQLLDTTPPASREHRSVNVAIDQAASVASSAKLGPNVVISAGAKIGENCEIGANTFIGENAQIGDSCKLWANVTVYHGVTMGKGCFVQSGAVIGSDGFGFANDAGTWVKIPQLGGVVIGDNCEIGACTSIDRGAIEDTIIGNNVILDNQVQIAHNVELGDHVAMAACSVIAGSTKVGKGCTFAGACGVNGHINITDNVHFTGMSMVTKDVKTPGVYSSGMPIMDNKEWRKIMVRFKQLDTMHQRIKALEVAEKTISENN